MSLVFPGSKRPQVSAVAHRNEASGRGRGLRLALCLRLPLQILFLRSDPGTNRSFVTLNDNTYACNCRPALSAACTREERAITLPSVRTAHAVCLHSGVI